MIVKKIQRCYNDHRKERYTSEEQKDNMPKDIQWHPAFVSAMNLELMENREEQSIRGYGGWKEGSREKEMR